MTKMEKEAVVMDKDVFEYSGTFFEGKKVEDQLFWNLNEEGVLTISGHGYMRDYYCGRNAAAPWDEVKRQIREIVFENGIISIGAEAFKECMALEKVHFPESLIRVHSCAFLGCTKLESVIGPEKAEYVHFYDSTEDINEYCRAINVCRKADSKIFIGLHAFYKTPWAEKMWGEFWVKDDVLLEYLGEKSCVNIPENIKVIGKYAFKNAGIESVSFPVSLEKIDEFAFMNNDLKVMYFPKNLRFVAYGAFYGNKNLYRIVTNTNQIKIEEAFGMTKIPQKNGGIKKIEELYGLYLKQEKKLGEYRRLIVKDAKKGIGRNNVDAGKRILQKIKAGSEIIGVTYNSDKKEICYVTGMSWSRLSDSPVVYTMEPCITDYGVDIWSDHKEYIGERAVIADFFLRYPDEFTSRDYIWVHDVPVITEWFCIGDARDFEGPAELQMLKIWMEEHLEYTIKDRGILMV